MVAKTSGSATLHSIVNQPLKGTTMSFMSNLINDLQNDIVAGRLTFAEIAAKHEVPVSWVAEVHCEMVEQECILFPEPTVEDCMYFDMGKEMAKEE
jgi:hypothetical protein